MLAPWPFFLFDADRGLGSKIKPLQKYSGEALTLV